ncbi:MAG: hypothetical protein ACLTRP_02995 [Clostridioides difficile]
MRNKLDNYIDEIANKFNTTDPYIIAEKLNIKFVKSKDYTIDCLYCEHNNIKSIIINENLSKQLTNYLVAREIGHALLCPNSSTLEYITNYYDKVNEFAVKLITISQYKKVWGDYIMKNNNKEMLQSNGSVTECNEVKQLDDVEKRIDKQEMQQQGTTQYEKKFYKLLHEQHVLIEQEKLLGEIEELNKKRSILKIKKHKSNDSTIEKNSKIIKELYKEA